MKKILAVMLAALIVFCMSGCKNDSKVQQGSNTLKVGVSVCEPMNYKEDGKWVGFDTEFAQMFAKELGMKVEFVEIKPDQRLTELENGNIDCIWNGFTINRNTAPSSVEFSKPYVKNAQVLVMKADRVANYNDGFEIKDLEFVVEKGSEGAFYIIERNSFKNVTEVESQMAALEKVKSGEADATLIDSTLAKVVTAEGGKYADLGIGFEFSDDDFGVVFKKGSDILPKLNEFIDKNRDGKLKELAEKYGVTLSAVQN